MKHGKKNTGIKLFGNKITKRARRLIYAALFLPALAGAILASVMLILAQRESRAAQDEYEGLREHSPLVTETSTPPPLQAPPLEPDTDNDPDTDETEEPETVVNLQNINKDYIGWIKIDGSVIDYPVVQGKDNWKYIYTTFTGDYNKSGTIFMDCRSTGAFDNNFAVLYGHNRSDGTMFTALHDYEDKTYLKEHPEITIALPDGETLTYRIFAARLTTVEDELYSLFYSSQTTIERYFTRHNAPEGAQHFLVLSTCTFGGTKEERLLVFAAKT